jgi:hypothetical protein
MPSVDDIVNLVGVVLNEEVGALKLFIVVGD